MYCGAYEHSLDPKHRVTVPSKFRDVLEKKSVRSGFMVMPGPDPCLVLFDDEQFQLLVDKFDPSTFADPAYKDFERFFFGMAENAELDSMGRILIPERLREYAGIRKEVTFVGVLRRVEIWDRSVWKERREGARFGFERNAADLFGSSPREGR